MQINVTKIILYVVLIALTIYCGRQFVARYSLLMATEVDGGAIALINDQPSDLSNGTPPVTNVVEAANGQDPAGTQNGVEGIKSTADPANQPPGTNGIAATPPTASDSELTVTVPLTKRGLERGGSADVSGIGFYVIALFGLLIVLGFLAAHDVSSFMAQRAHKFLHNEDGEGIHDANYDRAEEVWADGDFLEAVRLMREFLAKHPREVHAMFRIAEIYEKDLGNNLAAALEYEDLLKHKLPDERWGWAAIHLVNLYYGRLDKPAQGLALLWRIHREYGHTQAAGKARKRLSQIDPDFGIEAARLEREADEREALAAHEVDEEEEDISEESLPTLQLPDDSPSNLPKGFRPKKR